MLYSISGAQGCGKSTVLTALQELGFKVIERKTARSLLAEMGMTLEEVYSSSPSIIRDFQRDVLNRKHLDELEYINSDDVYLTERSYADLYTYSVILLGRLNSYSKFLDEYKLSCFEKQNQYSQVFYLENRPTTNVIDDGVRSVNNDYFVMVEKLLKYVCGDITNCMIYYPINSITLDDRIEVITKKIYERNIVR